MKKLFLTTAAAFSLFSASSFAQEADVVGAHCNALNSGGAADMSFVLGHAASGLNAERLAEFNQAFTGYIVRKYDINTAAGGNACPLEAVEINTIDPWAKMESNQHRPMRKRNVGMQAAEQKKTVRTAVISQKNVPVVLAYKLVQQGEGAWAIDNLSVNGQPLVGGYQARLNKTLKNYGFNALIRSLSAE